MLRFKKKRTKIRPIDNKTTLKKPFHTIKAWPSDSIYVAFEAPSPRNKQKKAGKGFTFFTEEESRGMRELSERPQKRAIREPDNTPAKIQPELFRVNCSLSSQ